MHAMLPGAVEAGAGSVMCSLNRINGAWACENEQALTVDLKGRMNFSGWVMSDWGGIHNSTPGGAQMAGVDQEQPGQDFLGPVQTLLLLAARTLNATGQSRVTLSLR